MQTMELRPKPRASRRWLVVVLLLAVLVVALCVGLVVQRSGRLTPGAGSDGPQPSSTTWPGLALPGAGDAVVRLQSTQSIARVDLADGATTLTSTPDQDASSDLLAGSGWVVSKTVGQPTGVLIRDGYPAQLLPPALQQAGHLYLAGTDRLWAVPDQPAAGFRTAVLLDPAGERVGDQTIRLPASAGVPVGRLGDSLVVVDEQGSTYVAGPEGLDQLSPGTLLAIGADTTLTWVCNASGKCDARLNEAGKTPQYLPAIRASLTRTYPDGVALARGRRGIVSPDRRWVALELPQATRTGARLVVIDLRSGRRVEIRGELASSGPDDQVAWTPNSRYLLALTDGQLRVLDVEKQTVVTPTGLPGGLAHLAVAGSPGM